MEGKCKAAVWPGASSCAASVAFGGKAGQKLPKDNRAAAGSYAASWSRGSLAPPALPCHSAPPWRRRQPHSARLPGSPRRRPPCAFGADGACAALPICWGVPLLRQRVFARRAGGKRAGHRKRAAALHHLQPFLCDAHARVRGSQPVTCG